MIKTGNEFLVLSILLASVMLAQGCSDKEMYKVVTIADDLGAQISFDESMIRESLLKGKRGFQFSIEALKRNDHREYGNLYTHCEILSSFLVMFANHRRLFSSEIEEIHETFRHLLFCADENRVNCAVTHIFYRPELLPEKDLYQLEGLTMSKNPYTKNFARLIVLCRADDDLAIFVDSGVETRLDDEDLLKTVCRYWYEVGQIKCQDKYGMESSEIYSEKKHEIIRKYKVLLKAG